LSGNSLFGINTIVLKHEKNMIIYELPNEEIKIAERAKKISAVS